MTIIEVARFNQGGEDPTSVKEANAWNVWAMPQRGICVEFDETEKGYRQILISADELKDLGFAETAESKRRRRE